MINMKTVLELLAKSLLYSLVVILIDVVIVFLITREPNQIIDTLSFVMLLEGGIGLTAGGGTAIYSPSGAKISEVLFRSKPWNAKRQKEVEKQARAWIATGIILVFEALLLSAV